MQKALPMFLFLGVFTQSHDLYAQSNPNFCLQTGTKLSESGSNWEFQYGFWTKAKNGHGDLIGIKKYRTDSKRVEIHILSSADNFQTFVLQTSTPLPESVDKWVYRFVEWDGDGILDLFAIKKSGTDTKKTEVHILSGASNFQKFIFESATALEETGNNWDFQVSTYGRNLYAIKRWGTSSHTTEIHILSAASGYKNFILQTQTPLPESGQNWSFGLMPNWNYIDPKTKQLNSSSQDVLIAVHKNDTDPKLFEVSVLLYKDNSPRQQQYNNFQTIVSSYKWNSTLEVDDRWNYIPYKDYYQFNNNDKQLNRLVAVKKSNTGTQSTEVHMISLD